MTKDVVEKALDNALFCFESMLYTPEEIRRRTNELS